MGNQESSHLVGASVPPKKLRSRTLSAVADLIKDGDVKRVVVMTGAGISTAAGIPDFRSPKTGLYANLKRLNLPYPEAVFDISYFRQHPEPFYLLAKELYPGKFHPTLSHCFIKLLEKKGLLWMLFTQNIDCLERAAGVAPEKIIEAHGSFAAQRCIECKGEYPADRIREAVDQGVVPRCLEEECVRSNGEGGLVKPDIVFFGEALPKRFDENAYKAAQADLVLVIGTSLSVYPFGALPEMAVPGVPRVLVNLERVGRFGTRADDVLALGPSDAGIRELASELGWLEELEGMWRGLVGEDEAERQIRRLQPGGLEKEMDALGESLEGALNLGGEESESESEDEGNLDAHRAVVEMVARENKEDKKEEEKKEEEEGEEKEEDKKAEKDEDKKENKMEDKKEKKDDENVAAEGNNTASAQ